MSKFVQITRFTDVGLGAEAQGGYQSTLTLFFGKIEMTLLAVTNLF